MARSNQYDVFISHSSKDESWAREFATALEAEGIQPWFAMANVEPGDSILEKMEQALRNAKVVIALVSHDYVKSPSTAFELGAAVGDHKNIIPILMRGGEPPKLPRLLRDRQWLEESSPRLAGKRVAQAVLSDKAAGRR